MRRSSSFGQYQVRPQGNAPGDQRARPGGEQGRHPPQQCGQAQVALDAPAAAGAPPGSDGVSTGEPSIGAQPPREGDSARVALVCVRACEWERQRGDAEDRGGRRPSTSLCAGFDGAWRAAMQSTGTARLLQEEAQKSGLASTPGDGCQLIESMPKNLASQNRTRKKSPQIQPPVMSHPPSKQRCRRVLRTILLLSMNCATATRVG